MLTATNNSMVVSMHEFTWEKLQAYECIISKSHLYLTQVQIKKDSHG